MLIEGADSLGFTVESANDTGQVEAWTVAAHPDFVYRRLTAHEHFHELEGLQREVMGVSDYDLLPASGLVLVDETGGLVLGAFSRESGQERMIGFSLGWGGYAQGVPRLCSDMLAVSPEFRSQNIGMMLKRLQAGLALEMGFQEIRWTTDPLRAANAQLNFHRLGAYADRYERNRYGETYGTGLYGGLPSDRLHVTWPIGELSVQVRLLGSRASGSQGTVEQDAHVRLVQIPAAIDELVQTDFEAAMAERMRVREELESAFADGYRVEDFLRDEANVGSFLVLKPEPARY